MSLEGGLKIGMTIDDNIDFLNEAKDFFEDVANDPKIKESIKIYLIIESLEIAVATMRKYKKIQEVIDNWTKPEEIEWAIREVLEDGNNISAKWEETFDPVGGSIPWMACSNCGGEAIRDNFDKYKLTDYCPNCGAKMESEG